MTRSNTVRGARAGLAVAATLGLAVAAFGQAGGLYLPENGGPASGAAMAGQAATARDAQTAWLNPAGMTRLESSEVLISFMPFYLGLEFNPSSANTIPGGDGGQQGGWLPGAGLFLAAPLSERWAFGFSVTSPAGLIMDPDDNWVGRSYVTEAQIVALNFQPSVGFKINDHVSVGAGVDIQYADFQLDFALPGGGGGPGGGTGKVEGDNWEVGFSLSLLFEPQEGTRIGVRYRSAMNHELDGDFSIVGNQRASTGLDLPQNVTLSLHHDVNERVSLLADFGWTNWSAFTRTVINTDVAGFEIPRDWKDTWNFGVGVQLRPSDRWLLQAGLAYVTSAVSDENRTPDLPVDRQVRFSIGAEYAVTDTIRVGGTFTYANLGNNKIDQSRGPGRIAGDYDADLFLIGLYAAFQF